MAFEVRGLRVEHLRLSLDGGAVSDLGQRCADYTLMVTGEPPKRDGGAEFFADAYLGSEPLTQMASAERIEFEDGLEALSAA
jgi:hypothetical protein